MLAVLVGVAALAGLQYWLGRRPPVPAPFDPTVSVVYATQQARASGRPVLVFATAEWCGPCKELKAGALTDPRVAALIRARTVPAYLDIDRDRDRALALGVRAIPTLIIMRNDSILAARTGNASADDLLEWLKQNTDGETPAP